MFPNSPFKRSVGSYVEPVAPPARDPDAAPLATLQISCDWLPYIRGAVKQLLLQSTWIGDDDAVDLAQQRVFNLMSMLQDAVSCADVYMECSNDFALSNPSYWHAYPDIDTWEQSSWAPIEGWVGRGDVAILPNFTEVAIYCDFPAFELTYISVAFATASTGAVDENWAIRLYDADNNLIHEIADDGSNPITYSGPSLPGVCRVVLHRRQDANFITAVAQIEQVYWNQIGPAGNCEPPVPLSIPNAPPIPIGGWIHEFNFADNGGGWTAEWDVTVYGSGEWSGGVSGVTGSYLLYIQRYFPSDRVLTDVWIEYAATNVSEVSMNDLMRGYDSSDVQQWNYNSPARGTVGRHVEHFSVSDILTHRVRFSYNNADSTAMALYKITLGGAGTDPF